MFDVEKLKGPASDKVQAKLYAEIAKKLAVSGTPADLLEAATEKEYEKQVTTIRIAVGTIFRLQDWGGKPRNPKADLDTLVGTEFSGKVVEGIMPPTTEVKSVFTKKVKANGAG